MGLLEDCCMSLTFDDLEARSSRDISKWRILSNKAKGIGIHYYTGCKPRLLEEYVMPETVAANYFTSRLIVYYNS